MAQNYYPARLVNLTIQMYSLPPYSPHECLSPDHFSTSFYVSAKMSWLFCGQSHSSFPSLCLSRLIPFFYCLMDHLFVYSAILTRFLLYRHSKPHFKGGHLLSQRLWFIPPTSLLSNKVSSRWSSARFGYYLDKNNTGAIRFICKNIPVQPRGTVVQ